MVRNTAVKLAEALKAGGWVLQAGNFPGNYRADRPGYPREVPTPEYAIKAGWYPGPTHQELDQIWFNVRPDGGVDVWHRTWSVPWVKGSEVKVSYRRAMQLAVTGGAS